MGDGDTNKISKGMAAKIAKGMVVIMNETGLEMSKEILAYEGELPEEIRLALREFKIAAKKFRTTMTKIRDDKRNRNDKGTES